MSEGKFDAAIRILTDHKRSYLDTGFSGYAKQMDEAIALLEAAGKITEGDAIGAECGVITEDALGLIVAALPEVEEQPKRYRCEGCGRTFDAKLFSHSGAVDDGKGNPIEVECGPISALPDEEPTVAASRKAKEEGR